MIGLAKEKSNEKRVKASSTAHSLSYTVQQLTAYHIQ